LGIVRILVEASQLLYLCVHM